MCVCVQVPLLRIVPQVMMALEVHEAVPGVVEAGLRCLQVRWALIHILPKLNCGVGVHWRYLSDFPVQLSFNSGCQSSPCRL
jgi:hypothetical protein